VRHGHLCSIAGHGEESAEQARDGKDLSRWNSNSPRPQGGENRKEVA
jgi:hypothetical protein